MTENFVREYVRRLSDEDLKAISLRFSQNLCGDKAEIADLLSRSMEIDKWLRSATTAADYFSMMDDIERVTSAEAEKRNQQSDKKDDKRPKKAKTEDVSVVHPN